MKLPKKVVDIYGDAVQVDVLSSAPGVVFLNDTYVRLDDSSMKVDFAFTPADARKLAKALKRAADEAEQ